MTLIVPWTVLKMLGFPSFFLQMPEDTKSGCQIKIFPLFLGAFHGTFLDVVPGVASFCWKLTFQMILDFLNMTCTLHLNNCRLYMLVHTFIFCTHLTCCKVLLCVQCLLVIDQFASQQVRFLTKIYHPNIDKVCCPRQVFHIHTYRYKP